MQKTSAFTLIELLVVMAIIALLSTLLFALAGTVGETQERTDTELTIMTTASAIDLFIADSGAVPLPTGDRSDVNSGSWYPATPDGSWEKQQLFWRVGHAMTSTEKANADSAARSADLAADPYQSLEYLEETFGRTGLKEKKEDILSTNVTDQEVEKYRGNMSQSLWATSADVDATTWHQLSKRGYAKEAVLNIRGTLAADAEKRKYLTFDTLVASDLPDPSFIDADQILDAWGNPLIYVAHSTPAVDFKYPTGMSLRSGNRPVGKDAGGRIDMVDRNEDGLIDLEDWPIQPPKAEDQIDHNGDTTTDEVDWGNILYYARPGNARGYFLASAGEDQEFNCVMSDSVNQDNIINKLAK